MINSIVLAGNVVGDPESRSTTTGKAIATFRLAVNNPLNDKDTLFIDVDTWEKQAEFVTKYVKKGSLVSVVGRLKQDSWEKDGKRVYKILAVADKVHFIGSKKKDSDSEPLEEASAKEKAKPATAKKAYATAAANSALDEDIPI